jgi:hypothetical protein
MALLNTSLNSIAPHIFLCRSGSTQLIPNTVSAIGLAATPQIRIPI